MPTCLSAGIHRHKQNTLKKHRKKIQQLRTLGCFFCLVGNLVSGFSTQKKKADSSEEKGDVRQYGMLYMQKGDPLMKRYTVLCEHKVHMKPP